MEIKGVVRKVMDTQQISDSFKKREFVIEDVDNQYPQKILFQTTQDRTSLLDGLAENDMVNVAFNIRGREWTSPQNEVKYFVSLEAWRIEKMSGGANDAIDASAVETDIESSEDDLPF